MLDSFNHLTLILLKIVFWREKQRYNECHYVKLLNLYTTNGLSILLHGVISFSDATSCDVLIKIHVPQSRGLKNE